MLKRKIYRRLLEWKERDHKSLLITGQRQIGKTYIIDAFAKAEYEHYVYINFSDSPEMSELFSGNNCAEELIKRLTLYFGTDSIVDGSTLLFLDEIQDCLPAYSSLKQFTIYGKIDVIASGSLLGVKMPSRDDERRILVPMGYEEQIVMYQLDFEEYLWAKGISADTIDTIRKDIKARIPIDDIIFKRISKLFREYLIVGGMPEAVDRFITTNDFRPVTAVHKELLNSCLRDINRYNRGSDIIRTTECFDSIPYQLADTNKKFMFSRIKGEGTRRSTDRYMEILLWIKNSGYGNFCYGLSQPCAPLKKNVKRDLFKVYLSDTGMLLQMYGDKARLAVYNGDSSYNMGAVIENAVANNLVKCGIEPMYYRKDKNEGRMELDFVTEFWDGVAVLEVKSGSDTKARSLDAVKRHFDVSRLIMFEKGNISVDEKGVEHYPLFASAFIDEMNQEPEGPIFS